MLRHGSFIYDVFPMDLSLSVRNAGGFYDVYKG